MKVRRFDQGRYKKIFVSIRILVKLLIKFNWVIWNEMCMYLFSIVN